MAAQAMPDRSGPQQLRPAAHPRPVDVADLVVLEAPELDRVDAEPGRPLLLQYWVRPDLRPAARIFSTWSGVSAARCCSTRLVPPSS